MACIRCGSETIRKDGQTRLGGQRWRCNVCQRRFTAHSKTAFAYHSFPNDVIALAVRWYVPYLCWLLASSGCVSCLDNARSQYRGRVFDNIFIERLWRTVTYEYLYLYEHETVPAVRQGLGSYFHFPNTQRPHQSLAYRTPAEIHTA